MISRRRSEDNVVVKNEDIIKIDFPKFDGKPVGSFKLVITPEKAEEIEDRFAGKESFAINVKHRLNRNDEEETSINVYVRWDKFPPEIKMFTYGDPEPMIMNEKTVGALNTADIVSATLVIGPSLNNGCYLSKGNFVINDIDLDAIDREFRGLRNNG